MLSLCVYNKNEEKANLLNCRCRNYIQNNSRKIDVRESCSDTASFTDTIFKLNDSAIIMLRKDEFFSEISECINLSPQNNYTVFVLETMQEMFETVTPVLRPSGLVLDSFDEENTGRVIDEIYADFLRITEKSGGPQYHFRIKGTDYSESFPKIYMIEVQSKKITFRTQAQDYEFYDSLDSVMKEAPDYFVRIHRSYVINMNYVKDIDFHEKKVVFTDDQEVFFSRNYASNLRSIYYRFRKEAVVS